MKKNSINKKVILCVLVLYAILLFLLNFIRIFDNNMSGDEAFSVYLAKMTIPKMLQETAEDVHPPLYYFFIMFVNRFIGNYGWAYHLLSIIPYAITLFVGLTWVRKRMGNCAALVFITFDSLMCTAVCFNVEIRMYSWAALFLLLSYCSLYEILHTRKIKYYALFAIFSLAGAYSHYFTLLAAAFFYAVLIVDCVIRRKYIKEIVFTCITTIVGYLPWFFVLLTTFVRTSNGFWMTRIPGVLESVKWVFWIGDGKYPNLARKIVFLLFLFLLLVVSIYESKILFIEKKESKNKFSLTFKEFRISEFEVWILAGVISMMGCICTGVYMSRLIRPMYHERYLYPIAVVIWLVIASCLSKVKFEKMYTLLLVGLLLVTALPVYINTYQFEQEQDHMTQETVQFFKENMNDDIIITDDQQMNGVVLRYYFSDIISYDWKRDKEIIIEPQEASCLMLREELEAYDDIQRWLRQENMQAELKKKDGYMNQGKLYIYQLNKQNSQTE